jgi:hypothetical protein
MSGDVLLSWLNVAVVLLTFFTLKAGCDTVCLHVSGCSALPAVLLDTTEAIIKRDNTVALDTVSNLHHGLPRGLLPWVSTERDLEGRDQRSTRIVCRCVGITMFEVEFFDETPEADLLVPRLHPVSFVTRHDLRVDVAYNSADGVHVEGNCLGLQIVLVVADVMAEDNDGVVALQARDTLDRLNKKVGQDSTSVLESDETALAETVPINSTRMWVLVREV